MLAGGALTPPAPSPALSDARIAIGAAEGPVDMLGPIDIPGVVGVLGVLGVIDDDGGIPELASLALGCGPALKLCAVGLGVATAAS